eukprot:gnl/TRDRNA2_/TRDRNA2_44453_c0_seq1.p1 gnl/TRDRNA2_/TRDRNA2_44453_c0~~gnl/TRDRNA2_/TRDRNA2_44453_c0_seq1.p1  ORF type:complete len:129 (-),score=6.37 gnl/TRDRNA2_/TRDRNA2_44453_c0_seq1:386-772(-)
MSAMDFVKASVFLQSMNLPLAVTSAKREPIIFGTGVGLMFALARLSTTLAHDSMQDASYVPQALNTLVATSYWNRTVRLSLGTVHLYAAFKYASCNAETNLWKVLNWTGTLALAFVSAMWITTGYYGQ